MSVKLGCHTISGQIFESNSMHVRHSEGKKWKEKPSTVSLSKQKQNPSLALSSYFPGAIIVILVQLGPRYFHSSSQTCSRSAADSGVARNSKPLM